MGQTYVGEIRSVGFNFAPAGWALCDGRTLAISEYDTLFNLIGTTYGGDGQSTFNLPNLNGRMVIHQGSGYVIGQSAGTETVTLTTNQIPVHTHVVLAQTAAGDSSSPSNATFAASSEAQYSLVVPSGSVSGALQNSGGSQPHDNMHPYLCINYCISLFGVFPSQN